MEFGIFDHVDSSGVSLQDHYDNRLTIVEAYDRGGFSTYHVAEHHATPLGLAASPGVYLAAVAQRTKKLRFGPLVYTLPLYHPLRLTEEICMLDQMSGGRLDVGIGRGISPLETKGFGIDPTERVDRYVETLQVMSRGSRKDRSTSRASTSTSRTCRWSFHRFKSRTRRSGSGRRPPTAAHAPRATDTTSSRFRRQQKPACSPIATARPGRRRTARSRCQSSGSAASSSSRRRTR